jgi:ABC-type sugar transport system ATPase subunit
MTDVWLSCRGVTKRYGGVVALAGVDLDLHAGEVHGLIGPNGAGKSTLVKILAAAVRRDGGTIRLDGAEITLHGPVEAQQHRLVLMPQEIAIVPGASVVDNVTLGAEATRYGFRSARECRRQAEAALAAVGLEVDPMARAGSLSAAQQRMLMMARALDREARLLILDEPTAGLPGPQAALVSAAVRRLVDHRLTVVYVSHHLSEVAAACDRVSCVREGRVVATLSGEEIAKDRLVSALLGSSGEERTAGAPGATPTARRNGKGAATGVELRAVSGARLDAVSMTAGPGGVVGVTGLLGSGVTELVRILVGAERPRSGTVRIGGADCTLASPADALDHGVGYLAGDRTLAALPGMSIRENVSLAALARWFGRLGLLRKRDERARVDHHLAALSITAHAERPLGSLSGGTQQRALVARLLAADAAVLVLDEPTVGVDVGARWELWDAVRAIASERTVIVASSEPEELVALCDRVVCIRDGRVVSILEGAAIDEDDITHAVA